jgi:hypothetical protein
VRQARRARSGVEAFFVALAVSGGRTQQACAPRRRQPIADQQDLRRRQKVTAKLKAKIKNGMRAEIKRLQVILKDYERDNR